jgi:isocitrate dehydrogenase
MHAASNQIQFEDHRLIVPANPTIPFIAGDGIGPEIMGTTRDILDAAIHCVYHGQRQVHWVELFAGEAAFSRTGSWLPDETLAGLKQHLVAIKGPLATPVGGGINSINVTLRRELDLYACQRPVRFFSGVKSPLNQPEKIDVVLFRENTEDVYAGIEFGENSPENAAFLAFFKDQFPQQYGRLRFPNSSALGVKPFSREGAKRLVRAAVKWALANHRRRVTLVHKGNIMKATEGGFVRWGYEVANTEFAGSVYSMNTFRNTRAEKGETAARQELETAKAKSLVIVDDIIADAMFQAAILRPQEFDVIATTNLNGDYLSDALAACVGGLGISPGANLNYETGAAVFEATHGTAPEIAGKNVANPVSLILSGALLLNYLGWVKAADIVVKAVEEALAQGFMTADLAQPGVAALTTSGFTEHMLIAIKGKA